jgi:hypothetical protein
MTRLVSGEHDDCAMDMVAWKRTSNGETAICPYISAIRGYMKQGAAHSDER